MTVGRRSLLIGGLLGAVAGCVGSSSTFHYRLRLNVRSGGRAVTDSAIQYFTFRSGTRELGSRRDFSGGAGGEGALVDLGSNGVLVSTFVRLLPPGSEDPLNTAFGDRPPENANWDPVRVLNEGLGITRAGLGPEAAADLTTMAGSPSVDLPVLQLPLLLHFPDPARPDSVRRFDPRLRGGAVVFESATVEVTADPLTKGVISTALPWADQYEKAWLKLDGRGSHAANNYFPAKISVNDFRR